MGSGVERLTADRKGTAGARRGELARGEMRVDLREPFRIESTGLGERNWDRWGACLATTDLEARSRVIESFQRAHGNATVQRLVGSPVLSLQRQPDEYGYDEELSQTVMPPDFGLVDEWPQSEMPADYGTGEDWGQSVSTPTDFITGGGMPGESPTLDATQAGQLAGGAGVVDNILRSVELMGGEIPGGLGVANDVLGGLTDLVNYSAQGQSTGDALASTAGGFLAGKGLDALGASKDPASIIINLVHAGATAAGASEDVTDVTGTLSSITLSQFGKDVGSNAFRAIENLGEGLATGDWSDMAQQGEDIQMGKSGGALQGYGMMGALASDLFEGKGLEESILQVGGKGDEESALGRMGSWLGDEAYQLINQDLPEAAEFAEKDLGDLWDWVTGDESEE